MSRMKINPFDTNDRKWKNYSEEQRMSKVVDNLIKYGHVYSAVALNHSSLQAQEAQNNQVYAGLIENVTGAPVNMHHSWPFTFRSIQSTTINGFKRPRAITIIPRGDVLVLECDGKCVSRIIANERVQLPHGKEFKSPVGIAVHPVTGECMLLTLATTEFRFLMKIWTLLGNWLLSVQATT